MILVKLGGSVLTTKGGGKRVRRAALRRLARELAGIEGLVVLHGAGSFGHSLAKRAALREGLRREAQRRAAARVAADVRALHLEVLRALEAAGLKPFSLPAGSVATARHGALARLDAAPFRLALEHGFTPVSCGDVVLDAEQGVAIVSADALARALAEGLGAKRVVFATDVDGLYTAPPGARGARLLERCRPEDLERLRLGGARGPDVTGGMAGKATELAGVAELGCEVWVVSGLAPGRVRAALLGQPPVGTLVSLANPPRGPPG